MLDVDQLNQLHRDTTPRWDAHGPDNPYSGLLHLACGQHECNYRLWQAEDEARRRDVDDATIARTKRCIDRLNQQRHDWAERLDQMLLEHLQSAGVRPPTSAPLNTETPASAVDRLSVLSLRIFHLERITHQPGTQKAILAEAQSRLAICRRQQADLSAALAGLWQELLTGRRRFALYRQLKMYDDPRFNPHLRCGREA